MTVNAELASSAASKRLADLKSVDKNLWLPIGVVLFLFTFFSLATNSFATLRNFTAVSGQAGTLLIACLGGTFVILMGSIDLSVGAMVLLSGAASVQLLNSTGVGAAVLAAVAIIGGVLGLINGVIYAYGRIPSFVVTLGTLSVFSGLALKLLDGRAIPFDLPGFEYIAIGQAIPHLPNIALCALLAWAAAVFIAVRTRFGRYMYLIGGGELVARTAGIPVRRYKILRLRALGRARGPRRGAVRRAPWRGRPFARIGSAA